MRQILPLVALALMLTLTIPAEATKTGLGITDFERNETMQVGETREITSVAYVFNTGDTALTLISQWIPDYAGEGIFVTASPNSTDLLPDESVPISLTVMAQEAGFYMGVVEFSYAVIGQGPKTTVGGSAHVTINVTGSAHFVIDSLKVVNKITTGLSEALVGETIQVDVTVSNIGDSHGYYRVSLMITEPSGKSKNVTKVLGLSGGTRESVTFQILLEQVGEYLLQTGDFTHMLVVREPSNNALIITVAVFGVGALICIMVIASWRKKKR